MSTRLNPYEKLIPKILYDLRSLKYRAVDLWPIQVYALGDCERQIGKINSKLQNVHLYLEYAGEAQKSYVRNRFRFELEEIVTLVHDIEEILEEKSWFAELLGRFAVILRPLNFILNAIGLGPLIRALLPPARNW